MDAEPTDRLGDRAKRGGAVVFAAMLVQRAIGLVCLAVLARQLSPRDFGLMGMLGVLTAVLMIFADLGLPDATVQRPEISRRQLSSAFWMNVLASLVITALMVALAPLMARFYGETELRGMTLLFALYFPILGLGAQHYALLVRRMEYKRLAISETLGIAAGAVTAILLARRGFGPYALVCQHLVTILIITSMNWSFAGWMPGLPARHVGLSRMVHIGGHLTASKLVEYVGKNLDNVLLGRFWGAASLGLYTRAYTLMTYPILLVSQPMARVTVPVLARLQHDPPRMRQAYLRVLKMIALVSFPLMFGLFVSADQVIRVVYGGKWSAVVPIFQVLCITGLFQGILNATNQLFVATGRTDRMLRCNAVLCAMMSVAFVVAIAWGPIGIAAAYAVAMTLVIGPYLAYAYATIDLSLKEVAVALRAPFFAAIGMAAVVWTFPAPIGPGWHPLLRLGLTGLIGASAYVALMALFARKFIADVLGYALSGLLPRVRLAPAGSVA